MKFFIPIFVLSLCAVSCAYANEDKLFCDFESNDYGAWKTEGDAFGPGPAQGTLPGQMNVSGYEGKGLVNSFYGGDGTVGKLTSPEFKIESKYISFLLGGGGHKGTHVDLIVDGKVVRIARGPNVHDGGSEELDWFSWDVADLIGQKARIEVIDQETGGWGHINIDQIVFSDKKKTIDPVERAIKIEKKYLWLPVKTGAPSTWFDVVVDGQKVREFIIELARDPNDVSFRATLDVSEWKDKEVKLIAERYPSDANGIDLIEQSDEMADLEESYTEKYRPQFHFAPRRGWTNDPNGLVYYKGEYHLFQQHNPFGASWNNMSWGHYVSSDLLHWKDLNDAFLPDPLGSIFSGSGVVDWDNTTGFKTGEEAPLVGIYTYNGSSMRYGARASQGIAYSNDCGRSWTKYEGNPVLPHIIGGNRDPKVFRYQPTNKWIMALYLDGEDYALFESDDLKSWDKICDVPNLGCSECPDIFELAVDGDEQNKKYVFWGGNGKYVVGTFDGKTFVKESEPLNMKWGGNDYAAQSYSDTPGRRIQFSWMQGGVYPDMPFNQQFTVPRELTLRSTPEGIRLCAYPVKELETLRGKSVVISNKAVNKELSVSVPDDELADAIMTIEVGDASRIEIKAHGRTVTLLPKERAYLVDDVRAPMNVKEGKVELRMVFDRMSLETFVDGGLSQIAKCFVPQDDQKNDIFEFVTDGKDVKIDSFEIWPLKSVWK